MIINTGQRTDIPGFYSEWLANRLRDGSVMVRNPYNPAAVTRYRLSPDVVDLIGFCTKNPAPMLDHMELLAPYRQYWYVTITPYGREIEPHVPDKGEVLRAFRAAGVPLSLWTVNDPEIMAAVLREKADILITNYPDVACQERSKNV